MGYNRGSRKICTSTHYIRTDFLEQVVLGEITTTVKENRKILSNLMTLVFAMSMIISCSATENIEDQNSDFVLTMQIGNPVMTVNGAEKPIDADGSTPVIVNNRTLLPIRAVVEEMGGTVSWDSNTQTVTLNYNFNEIKLIIDSLTATLNGAAQTLDTAPTIINDRTMLSISFIAESL